MNPSVILSMLADLYQQVVNLTAENRQLRDELAAARAESAQPDGETPVEP